MDFQDIVGRKVDLVTPKGLCPYTATKCWKTQGKLCEES